MSTKTSGSIRATNAPIKKRRIVVVTFAHLANEASTQARRVRTVSTPSVARSTMSCRLPQLNRPMAMCQSSGPCERADTPFQTIVVVEVARRPTTSHIASSDTKSCDFTTLTLCVCLHQQQGATFDDEPSGVGVQGGRHLLQGYRASLHNAVPCRLHNAGNNAIFLCHISLSIQPQKHRRVHKMCESRSMVQVITIAIVEGRDLLDTAQFSQIDRHRRDERLHDEVCVCAPQPGRPKTSRLGLLVPDQAVCVLGKRSDGCSR